MEFRIHLIESYCKILVNVDVDMDWITHTSVLLSEHSLANNQNHFRTANVSNFN